MAQTPPAIRGLDDYITLLKRKAGEHAYQSSNPAIEPVFIGDVYHTLVEAEKAFVLEQHHNGIFELRHGVEQAFQKEGITWSMDKHRISQKLVDGTRILTFIPPDRF